VLVLLSSSFCEKASAQESPEKVAVLPVFVVPKGQRAPEKQDSQLFARHLLWTQTRYREMLGNKSTFRIQKKIETLRSKWTVADFEKSGIRRKSSPKAAGDHSMVELIREAASSRSLIMH